MCIYFDSDIRGGPYTQEQVRLYKKKKKNQVKSSRIWSRVPEPVSDPPIGSDRESGCDKLHRSSSCMSSRSTMWVTFI